jgi:hypothetical protein
MVWSHNNNGCIVMVELLDWCVCLVSIRPYCFGHAPVCLNNGLVTDSALRHSLFPDSWAGSPASVKRHSRCGFSITRVLPFHALSSDLVPIYMTKGPTQWKIGTALHCSFLWVASMLTCACTVQYMAGLTIYCGVVWCVCILCNFRCGMKGGIVHVKYWIKFLTFTA